MVLLCLQTGSRQGWGLSLGIGLGVWGSEGLGVLFSLYTSFLLPEPAINLLFKRPSGQPRKVQQAVVFHSCPRADRHPGLSLSLAERKPDLLAVWLLLPVWDAQSVRGWLVQG